jgi:hypothetical protein
VIAKTNDGGTMMCRNDDDDDHDDVITLMLMLNVELFNHIFITRHEDYIV